jgi:hypothetical protein
MVPALPAIMRVLNACKLKIPFPIGTLFFQRCRTVANLDPARSVVRAEPSLLHVPQILALGDGAAAESPAFDRFEKGPLATGLDFGADKITHRTLILILI